MNPSSTCNFCKAPWPGRGNLCGCGGSEWTTPAQPFKATEKTVCRFCGSHWSRSTRYLRDFETVMLRCACCAGHEWVNPTDKPDPIEVARKEATAENYEWERKKREAEAAERALHEGDIGFLDVVSFYSWLLILGIPIVAFFWGWAGTFSLLAFAVLAGFVMSAMNHRTLGKVGGAMRCIPACGGLLLMAAPFVYLLFTMKC